MVTNPQGAATREGPLHFFFVGGRYDDDFVRTAAGWKIAQRVETTLWFQGSLPDELLDPALALAAAATTLSWNKPGRVVGPDGSRRARVVGERRRRALRVRVVGAAHVEVAGLADEPRRQLVRERRHPHLAAEVLARPHARAARADGR